MINVENLAQTYPRWATMIWQATDCGDLDKVIELVFALEVDSVH